MFRSDVQPSWSSPEPPPTTAWEPSYGEAIENGGHLVCDVTQPEPLG